MPIILAIRALGRSPQRSALTILGLLIAVAAVIVVTGLSAGARTFLSRRLKSLGTNVIFILPQPGERPGAVQITEGDANAIGRDVASIANAAPIVKTKVIATASERTVTTTVYGTTLPYFTIRDWGLSHGSFWSESDELTKARVCVLGETIARQLFGREDPIDRIIRIGGYPYRVEGVLSPKGRDVSGVDDEDDRIVMPIGSAKRRLTGAGEAVDLIIASASSARAAPRAVTQIDAIMRQRHRRRSNDVDFVVQSQERFLQIQSIVFDSLTAFLICVAAMSLLVGGIGVMNIMLVSVTERTREIGIRMAVGASRADVLQQFLVEATTLAAIGGAAGVAAGVAALQAFGALLGWPLSVSPTAVIASVAASAFSGVVFGFAPAHRASRLDPIEALRRE